jgi:hypothetical protein
VTGDDALDAALDRTVRTQRAGEPLHEQQIACPTCSAGIGERCHEGRGKARQPIAAAYHATRSDLARCFRIRYRTGERIGGKTGIVWTVLMTTAGSVRTREGWTRGKRADAALEAQNAIAEMTIDTTSPAPAPATAPEKEPAMHATTEIEPTATPDDTKFLRELAALVMSEADAAKLDPAVAALDLAALSSYKGDAFLLTLAAAAATIEAVGAAGLGRAAKLMLARRGVKFWETKETIANKRDTLRGYLLAAGEAVATDAITHHGALLALEKLAPAGAEGSPAPSAYESAIANLQPGDVVDLRWQPSGARTIIGGPSTKLAKFVRWANGSEQKRVVLNVQAVDTRGNPTGRFGSDRTFHTDEIVAVHARPDETPAIAELPPTILQAARKWAYDKLAGSEPTDAITDEQVAACFADLEISKGLHASYAPLFAAALAEVVLAQSLARSGRDDLVARAKASKGRKPKVKATVGDTEPHRIEVNEDAMAEAERGIEEAVALDRTPVQQAPDGPSSWVGAKPEEIIADIAALASPMERGTEAHRQFGREMSEICGADGGAGGTCLHQAGHVAAGQKHHSNGIRTWSDRKPRKARATELEAIAPPVTEHVRRHAGADGTGEEVELEQPTERKRRPRNERIYVLMNLSLAELQGKYAEMYGRPTKAEHKRVLAWRISLAEEAIARGEDPRKAPRAARAPRAAKGCTITTEQVRDILRAATVKPNAALLRALAPLVEHSNAHPHTGDES